MDITRFQLEDFQLFWPLLRQAAAAQSSLLLDPDLSYDEAFEAWCLQPQVTYIGKIDGKIVGSYCLQPHAAGPGSHIADCTLIVAESPRQDGIKRLLCQHAQQIAIHEGFQALQFDTVVETDQQSLSLLNELGFRVIGSIPQGFRHKTYGLVDVLHLYKRLTADVGDIVARRKQREPAFSLA